MNRPLTPEEAKNLTFPCLLEVWDNNRRGYCEIIRGIAGSGRFFTITDGIQWQNAALPSSEITEAMRKQFAPQSEYPKRMLVWDGNEEPEPRIVLSDLGEKTIDRYIAVFQDDESKFENGENFTWYFFKNAKPLPEKPDPISQEIAELEKRIAELKAKQQTK